MSNYFPVDYEQAGHELKSVYDDIRNTMSVDDIPSWASYMGNAPHLLKGLWSVLRQVTQESHISPLLTELLFYSVAYTRTAPYCMEMHAGNILRMTDTLEYDDLMDIVEGNSQGLIPDSYKTAIAICIKLTKTECSLQPEDFQQLKNDGFNNVQCMEIATLTSVAVMFNLCSFAADFPLKGARYKN